MEKQDLVKEISVSIMRLGLFFSDDTKEFLWCLEAEQLILILRFLSRLQRFYRKGK